MFSQRFKSILRDLRLLFTFSISKIKELELFLAFAIILHIIPINAIVDIFKRKGNKFEAVKHARKFLSSEDGNREGETGL